MAKYLDYTGLTTVWQRIKAYVKAKLSGLVIDGTTGSDAGKAVVKITQAADGSVTAELGGVSASNTSITSTTGAKFTDSPTTVEAALSKIGDALGSSGSVASQINYAIDNAITQDDQGHVTVTLDSTNHVYTIGENDIASANALASEITRAGNAETQIDSVVGLSKSTSDETRTYANTGTYIGKQTTNTVTSDIKALDDAIGDLGNSYKALQTAVTDSDVNTAKVVTKVTQNDQGVITATKQNITEVVLSGYSKTSDTGAVAATDTLVKGLSKLENRIAAEETNRANAINGLDSNVTLGTTNATQPSGSGLTRSSSVTVLQGVKIGEVDGKLAAVGNDTNSSNKYTLSVDAAGAANAAYNDALTTLKGTSADTASDDTIAGAKKYADSLFGGVTSISYDTSYSTVSSLPSTGAAGVIYLIPNYEYFQIEPSEQSPAVTNPVSAGYYVKNNDGTYSLTSDTSVTSGHTYYTRREAYDEYIYVGTSKNGQAKEGYEKLGGASLNLGDYLEKNANITTSDINTITSWNGSVFTS